MSRSRKKCGVIKDNGRSKKYDKRLANKAVRHRDLASGCAYKRVYNHITFVITGVGNSGNHGVSGGILKKNIKRI